MKTLVAVMGAILALASFGRANAADLTLYGRLPTIEDAALSPNGTQLAMIQTDGERRHILVGNVDSKAGLANIDAGSNKVRYLEWADDDNLIVVMSSTTKLDGVIAPRGEYYAGLIINLKAHTQSDLIGKVQEESLNIVYGRPAVRTVNGRVFVYATGESFVDGQGVFSIFETSLAVGNTHLVNTGNVDTDGYIIGDDGQVMAESRSNARSGDVSLWFRIGKSMRRVALPKGLSRSGVNLLSRTADGKSVLVSYRIGDKSSVAEITQDAELKPVEGLDESGIFTDSHTDRMIGTVVESGDSLTYNFIQASDRAAWTGIVKAFAGQRVSLQDLSADHKRFLVQVDFPTDGASFYLIDLATGQASVVGDLYRNLKPANISPVKAISYKAADGMTITGYLTLPKAKVADPKGLALIVLPHGGPAARDDLSYDWWSQALAAEGYAVLRPNYRGSDGFGREFLEAGFGEWGKKMQTDLSDGVRYLAGQGIIDPAKVCIVGASYGGYAALAGATLDKGVYRCAASVSGPADLRRMLFTDKDDNGLEAYQYWTKFMGVDGMKDPKLAAISPAMHADAVSIPILLVHGKDDSVVLYEQSKIMADALKKAGKPYEFVTLDGEDHWLSRGATRLKMLQAVTTFVEKNNPPN